jgi:hypothetical protein
VNLIRYIHGSRRFRKELHERDSLFAITLLAHTHNDTVVKANIGRGMWIRKDLFRRGV